MLGVLKDKQDILRPTFLVLSSSIAQDPLLVPALALCPQQLHHICVAVPNIRWRTTAVGALH
jgi:hypothetical protein